MMRALADDVELLERAANIAGMAIWPAANVTVSDKTLRTLADEVEAVRVLPTDYRLIDHDAVWLLRAAERVIIEREQIARADKDGGVIRYTAPGETEVEEIEVDRTLLVRWTRYAELFRAAVEIDLHNAKQTLKARG